MEVDQVPSTSGSSVTPIDEAMESTSQEDSSKSVIAPAGSGSGVVVSLHPLVIMNISEHWTRTKAQTGTPTQVYGAIIGKQNGRDIEIMNSFELNYNTVESKVIIDLEYYKAKEEQFKQVFTHMDFLGWYSTGENPTHDDLGVHRQIVGILESPLFLQMNPSSKNTELPVKMYESLFDMIGGTLFVSIPFALSTEEAERIGLDHVARISTTGSGENNTCSKISEPILVQHSAIKMLASRVKLILDYVSAVQKGELPKNNEILREAKALANRLPIIENERFKPEFYSQYNDVALMTYLGTIQKSCNNLNQFVNKFNILFQRQSTGRRTRGIYF